MGVLQRLLEHCRPDQLEGLVESLLTDTIALSTNIYGKYVIQHVLEHGTSCQQQNVMNQLQQRASTVVQSTHGPAVIATALSHVSLSKTALIDAILNDEGTIVALARTRQGSLVVQKILQSVDEPVLGELYRQLSAQASLLGTSRYGRGTLKHLTSRCASSDNDALSCTGCNL